METALTEETFDMDVWRIGTMRVPAFRLETKLGTLRVGFCLEYQARVEGTIQHGGREWRIAAPYYKTAADKWHLPYQRGGAIEIEPSPTRSEREFLNRQIRQVIPPAICAFVKEHADLIEPGILESEELSTLSVRVPDVLNSIQCFRDVIKSMERGGGKRKIGPIVLGKLDKIRSVLAAALEAADLIGAIRDEMEAKVVTQSRQWLEDKENEYDKRMAITHAAQAAEGVTA